MKYFYQFHSTSVQGHTQMPYTRHGRQKELLPVPYYHVIFTLPHELRAFARRNQQKVYGLLIKSAAGSILKLTGDPRYVGGRVGVMAVLHTWGSNLSYHLHVHCLVTGGGLSSDGHTWMPARENYLVPVRALSRLFRGSFLDSIRRQFKDIDLPKSIRQKEWVVYCKPAVQGTRTVLNYLARYIHRVAITNSRIISADNGKVTFRYKGSRGDKTRTMTVSAQEFIRRFLQHVLPAGVHKVRYYGLWSSSNRKKLLEVRQILTTQPIRMISRYESKKILMRRYLSHQNPDNVPHCQKGTLIWIGRLLRRGRASTMRRKPAHY
jgi:hypothetical protein